MENDLIEQLFSSAEGVIIEVTQDYNKAPTVFAISIRNTKNGLNGYNILLNSYKNSELTLAIRVKNAVMDISIVDLKTADSINIKGLKYDKTELDLFLKQPRDRAFVLAMADANANHPTLLALDAPPSFLTAKGFSVIKD